MKQSALDDKYITELRSSNYGLVNILRVTIERLNGDWEIWVEHYISASSIMGLWWTFINRIKAAWFMLIGREYLLQDTYASLEDYNKFHTEVGKNLLAVAYRELERQKGDSQ